MRAYPGCMTAVTGKDQKNINAMFNNKILYSYNRFNPKVLNTTPVQLNNTSQKSALTVSLKVLDEITQDIEIKTSIIMTSETSEKPDSPTNLSGNRYKYVYVDEAPLHKRIESFLGSIFPTLNQGPRREGLLVMAGTIEPSLTSAQVSEFYRLIQRTKNLNIRTEMIPVWLGLFEKNGYSNKAAGLLWYEMNCKKFSDVGDNKGLRDFKMQYCRDEQDIFEFSQGGMLEDDVNDILVATLKKLAEDGTPEAPYKIVQQGSVYEAIPDSKVRKKDDNGNYLEGGYWLIEPPKQGISYHLAIDGVATGTEDGEEKGSWMASVMFKDHDPDGRMYEPVGFYFERPKTIELGYIHTVNLFKFYNKFGGVKEINAETAAATGSHFSTFLEKEGLIKYAMKRKDLSGLGYSNKKKLFTPVNEDTLNWQIRQANMFLRRYGHLIRSIMLLKDLLKPANENADLRSAFFNFLTSIPNFDKPLKAPEAPRTKTTYELVRNGNKTSWKTTVTQVKNPHQEEVSSFEAFVGELKQRYGEAYWYNNASGEEKEKYRRLKGSPI